MEPRATTPGGARARAVAPSRRGLVSLLLLAAALLGVSRRGAAQERAVASVVVNTQDRGERFVAVGDDGDVLVSAKDLKEWGFKDLVRTVVFADEAWVSLKSLAPELKFELDREEWRLKIDAAPGLLTGQVLDLRSKPPEDSVRVSGNSAFLNYNATYLAGRGLDFESFGVAGEAGVNIAGFVALNTFAYTDTESTDRFVRLLTNLTKDDERTLRRYVVGDIIASSSMGEGRVAMVGMSVSKNFSIEPYYLSYPGVGLNGFLETPSEVEIYRQGQLLRTERLPPGPLSIENLPVPSGSGEVSVVIRDAYGRETQLESPYYFSARVLRSGVHEYSYNLGVKRLNLGSESWGYREWSFAGFHRVGLNDRFTAGLRLEVDGDDAINTGPTLSYALPLLGEGQTIVEYSHSHGVDGTAVRTTYTRAGRSFVSPNLALRWTSDGFRNAFDASTLAPPEWQGRVGVTFRLRTLGTVSLAQLFNRPRDAPASDLTQVSYTLRLPRAMTLNLSGSWSEDDADRRIVALGLNIPMTGRRSMNLSTQVQDGKASLNSSFQQSTPIGLGLGYRASFRGSDLSDDDSRRTRSAAEMRYRGPYGTYFVSAEGGPDEDSAYVFSTAGSLALVDGDFYVSRPIRDSFALVDAGEVGRLPVRLNNQDVGTTNRNGRLLVPELVAFTNNRVSLYVDDLGLDYSVHQSNKAVRTGLRGGGVVEFDIDRVHALEGQLRFRLKGVSTPARFATLELSLREGNVEYPLGEQGEFYIEDLPPGTYPARVRDQQRECRFELKVPAAQTGTADLGEIDCE